jgi:histone deacetylase 1/2
VNQHVTPDLAALTDSDPSLGNDHLHVGDGKDLPIYHIEHVTLHSPKHTFTLSNVLHVCHITKPLLSVQKFYCDNNVYFEFHASVFYAKDLTTKAILLLGQSNEGLYILSESSATAIPKAYWSPYVSATTDIWRRRLGHPTSCIFNLLVSKNKIKCTSRRSLVQCQACPLGKCSRLSLRPTGHKTSAPLDLIFSDVWGLLLCFHLMVFITLLSLSMCIQNMSDIILLLPNQMCFLYFNISNCLLSLSFPVKLNLFKLIGVVNIAS